PVHADEKAELKLMQGTWLPTAMELGGKKLPDEQIKATQLVVTDGQYSVTVAGQTDKGTLKLDVTAKPKAMDIAGTDGPNKGKSIPAIYELSGDTLKICYALQGTDRPAKFESKAGTATFLVTYQRAKK